jgi:hypothetical protein
MAVRKWYIDEALHSFPRLMHVLRDMSEEEVIAALKLECETRRRRSIMYRLVSRAARLNELKYVEELKRKYYNASKLDSDANSKG